MEKKEDFVHKSSVQTVFLICSLTPNQGMLPSLLKHITVKMDGPYILSLFCISYILNSV